MKREYALLKTAHENMKVSNEKSLQQARSKYKDELDIVMRENENLQSTITKSKDKESLRNARWDLEEVKRRNMELQSEVTDLWKERDEAKESWTEIQINHNWDIEEERSKRRTLASENDSLKFKV